MLVVTQLVLPPFLAGKVEDRLTARGGTASVDLDAVPALRLLAHDGDRFDLEGRGLEFPLDQEQSVFDKLDGFDSVRVQPRRREGRAFTVRSFALSRGDGETRLPVHLLGRLVCRAGIELPVRPASAAALVAPQRRDARRHGRAANRPVPFTLDAELASDGGEPRFVRGSGSVAGIPAGPLAALLAQSVLSRL